MKIFKNLNSQKIKKILTVSVILTSVFSTFAKQKQVRIGILNGPSAIPCAYLIENKNSSEVKNLAFENFASVQTELPKLLKGELDIGFLPPNIAAKVFNSSNKKIVCLGVTGNGNLYLLSKTVFPQNFSLESLKGKTVQCAGQGATPEFIFKYLLSKNGLQNQVNLDFSIPNANIAAALISDKIEFALVPEPFATVAQTKSPHVKRILNIQAEYEKLTEKTFPMTLLVANADFAKNNKKLIKKIAALYAKSNEWTVKNPKEAGILAEKANLGLKAAVAEKSIPNANFIWQDSLTAKKQIESILSVFLQESTQSIGGKLPDDDFYFSLK